MNEDLKKWVLVTFLLFLVVSAVHFLWTPLPNWSYGVVVGFAAFTYLLHVWTTKAEKRGPNPHIRAFMMSTMFKLVGTLTFIAVFLYTSEVFRTEITMITLLSYAAFLILSVRLMQAKLKSSQSKGGQ